MDTESTLDVLFIYPSYGGGVSESRLLPARVEDDIPNQESPNIGMGYLLAKAKQYGIRAKFMDMVFDNVSADDLIDYVKTYRPTLVGFTAFTVHIKAAGYLAERIKLAVPDTVVSIGGVHASAIPLETLDEFPAFDFAYCGEAEDTLADIVEYATNPTRLAKVPGVVMRGQTTFQPNWTQDISTLPFPAWEEFELSRYGGNWPHFSQKELPILAQRGCPYQCNFCMRASGRTVRMRPPESVIAEIERNIERIQQKPCSYFVEEAMQNIRGYITNKNRKTEKVRRKLFVRHKIIENNFGRKLRRLFRNLIGNVCKYHRLRSESNLIHQLHFI